MRRVARPGVSGRGRSRTRPVAYGAPTLLIQGADDPYGSLEQLDRIEANAGGPIDRLVLPGGHSPHLEDTQQVVRATGYEFVAALP